MRYAIACSAFAFATALAVPAGSLAQGMGSTPASTSSGAMVAPAKVFDKLLTAAEKEIEDAAAAMPAEKYNFAPPASAGTFTGVRTYAAEVRHITEANYGFFHGWDIPGGKSRADIEKLTSREDILAALKDSYTYAHAAMATITAQNAFTDMDGKGDTRAGIAAYSIGHNNDHYGQMVEYLRMNGIIPPASRK